MHLTEKLSAREAVLILIGVVVYGLLTYGVDQFIYRPCGIPIPWEIEGRLFTSIAIVGFSVLSSMLFGRIRWFSNHLGWLVTTSISVVFVLAFIVVRFWCY